MTVGLVLEGGGMRGMFTAGVLDALMEQHIQINKIIGIYDTYEEALSSL